MNKLLMPVDLDKSQNYKYYIKYNKGDVDQFFDNINMYTNPITKFETLYLESKTISQNKLRDAGFSITRSKDKADMIVISSLESLIRNNSTHVWSDVINIRSYADDITPLMRLLVDEESKNYKYVFASDLYKAIYKYDGNKELFTQILELMHTNDNSNVQMGMEFMTNANWDGNELYLQELFNLFWQSRMRFHDYKNCISFKGFLKNLDFLPSVSFYKADSYRDLCKTDEHHEYIYNKYKEEFENNLETLFKEYKIKLDKIEYSIDKSFFTKEEQEC
jgi:hypothetical protein